MVFTKPSCQGKLSWQLLAWDNSTKLKSRLENLQLFDQVFTFSPLFDVLFGKLLLCPSKTARLGVLGGRKRGIWQLSAEFPRAARRHVGSNACWSVFYMAITAWRKLCESSIKLLIIMRTKPCCFGPEAYHTIKQKQQEAQLMRFLDLYLPLNIICVFSEQNGVKTVYSMKGLERIDITRGSTVGSVLFLLPENGNK